VRSQLSVGGPTESLGAGRSPLKETDTEMDMIVDTLLRYGDFWALGNIIPWKYLVISHNTQSHKYKNNFCLLSHSFKPAWQIQSWHFFQRNLDYGCRANQIRKLRYAI
jgi:hypothetical protein